MRAKELKAYILEDKDRLYTILKNAGFHDFKENVEEIRCALPDMTNSTGVMIKLNETLYTSLFELGYTGDLFGALAVVLKTDFRDVISYIDTLLGISNQGKPRFKDPLQALKSLSRGHSSSTLLSGNRLYDASFMNRFVAGPHHKLIEEGILPQVANEFDIRFDPFRDRIVFPHYDWIHTDKVVGVQGRTLQSPEEMEILGTAKYWNYIKHFRKSSNLYGFSNLHDRLDEMKMLIIFEGEKSVLKEYTFSNGQGMSVALGGHSISTQQAEFILAHTPADCEVVLAFDKDVMVKETEGEKYIRAEAKKLMPFKKVSYIYDTYNLLGEKDSPIDKGYKVWKYLLKWRKQFSEIKS